MTMHNPPMGRTNLAVAYRVGMGRYLRGLRDKVGASQADVAVLLDVSVQMVSSMEVGRLTVPPYYGLGLADILEVPRPEFGRELLRWTNPWTHALIFSADPDAVFAELAPMFPPHERVGSTLPTAHPRRQKRGRRRDGR